MTRNASLLGLASLLFNLFSESLHPEAPLRLGNLFLFVSANVYGIIGGSIAAFISEAPRLLLMPGDSILTIQNIAIVGILGFVSLEWALISNAIPFILSWVIFSGLLHFFSIEAITSQTVLLFTYDLMLLAMAKMLLMSTTLCSWLTARVRHLSAAQLIPEALFIAFTICNCIVLTLPLNTFRGYEIVYSMCGAYSLLPVALISCIPLSLGFILTRIILTDYAPEFQSALRSASQKLEFTGLRSTLRNRPSEDLSEPIIAQEEEQLGVLTVTSDGTVLFLNSLFRHISGLPQREGLGTKIHAVFMHPPVKEALLSLLKDAHGPGIHTREIRLEDELTGKSRFFEVHLSESLQRGANSEKQYSFRVRNITDRRTVESHLLQAKKVESLGTMVNGIAHSFNDALTAITGQASLARMTRDNETTQHALDQILETSKQAGMLVQQLLDFALDTSHLRHNENLVDLIRAKSELLQRSMGDSYELIIEEHASSLPVLCNANLLIQAITNLILNAMESYANGTGRIWLQIDQEEIPPELAHFQPSLRPGTFARIRIKDAGEGMPPEVLAKAFDPLYTTKSTGGHSGLGLSIVFAVVRAHDGFLTAESDVGKGTTISLYLPFSTGPCSLKSQSSIPYKPSNSQLQSRLEKKKVLMVEDDPAVREILELLFAALHCEVFSFASAEDAVRKLSELSFDIFLVDLVLPGMSGFELSKKIRETKGDNTPGVLMSGYAIEQHAEEARLHQLRKPFDINELEEALFKALSA